MCAANSRPNEPRSLPISVRSRGSRECPDPALSIREVSGFVLSEARYAPGYRGGIHHHPAPLFVYVVNGGFRESCSCGCVTYGPGSLHFHPGDDPHAGTIGDRGAFCFNVTLDESWWSRVKSDIGHRQNEVWPKAVAALA